MDIPVWLIMLVVLVVLVGSIAGILILQSVIFKRLNPTDPPDSSAVPTTPTSQNQQPNTPPVEQPPTTLPLTASETATEQPIL